MSAVHVLVSFILLGGPGDQRYIDPVGGVTLPEAIAQGLRAEPGLQAGRTAVDAARGERRQAALRPNPAIAVERREQAGGTDTQTSVMVDVPLDLFRRKPRMLAADRGIDAATAAVADRERLLAAAIRDQFGEVLAAVRRLEILDGAVAVSRRTLDLLRDRAAAGAAPPLERDLAAVETRRLEGERELAAGRADVAIAALRPMLGLDAGAELRLRGSLEPMPSSSAADPAGAVTGTTERSDIREAQARVALAGARLLQAGEERKPEVGIFAGYMRMDAGFPQSGFNAAGMIDPIHATFNSVAAGLRVMVPVFNRGQGTIAAARAQQAGAAYELDARRLAARADVAAAHARADAASRALAIYAGDARTLARKNLDVVRETYALGRATLFDVLNEQRRYLDFENAYTDALAEAFAAQTALQRATGDVR